MSWHTSGLVIHQSTAAKDYRSFLQKLGIEEPEFTEALPFDDAISATSDGDAIAIASADGWTSIWGSMVMVIVDDDDLAKASRNSEILSFLMEGASGSYMFEWWENGKPIRKRFTQAGEIVLNDGTPLPQEKAIFENEPDEEEQIFALIDELTLPFQQLSAPTFHVFAIEDELADLLGE